MKMKETIDKIMSEEEGNLFYFIEADDVTGVNLAIKNGVSVNTFFQSTNSAWSALHICAEKGRTKCAEVLLKNGANINSTDTWGQSPLMYAVVSEWLELIDLLIKYRANLEVCDSNGQTALHLALHASTNECMQKLCKAGADIEKKDVLGRTPLWHAASRDGRFRQLEYLLSVGANPTTLDAKDKFTPLQAAIWYTESDRDRYIDSLLDAVKHRSVSPPDSDTTPLMTITHRSWCVDTDLTDRELDLVKRLLTAGCPLDVCAVTGVYKGMPGRYRMRRGTALKMAAHRGASSMVRVLLEHQADTDIADMDGVTPLHMAVYYNHPECVRLLIAYNANLNLRAKIAYDSQRPPLLDVTPFSCALSTSHIPLASLLIQAGYRVSLDRSLLTTDHMAALVNTYPEFVCWVMNIGTETERLKRSCRRVVRERLGRGIERKVGELPLPTVIKSYILLENVLR